MSDYVLTMRERILILLGLYLLSQNKQTRGETLTLFDKLTDEELSVMIRNRRSRDDKS